MPGDNEWVKEKLAEIEAKRKILKALENNLEAWEREIDWEEIPLEKQTALMALAEESVSTLQTLIDELKEKIRAGLTSNTQDSEE
jgi:hypothetical protein